jgi:uncharacterized protein YdaU (DUF1376 family)
MNFYKRYMGDFARDTAHLTMIENGAYDRLLDHYYSIEQPLPAGKVDLYRIARAMSGAERRAVDKVVDEFFHLNGDGLRHNKRADEEIKKREGQAEANKRIAEERERRRRVHKSLHETTHEQNNESSTNRSTNDQPNHSHSQKELLTPPSESVIPDCPHRELLALYAKHLPMLTQPRVWEGKRADLMRARWQRCAKACEAWPGYSTQADGIAFWDQFFAGVAESKTLTDGIPRREGNGVWKPDLPWLLKAENFAKVIEGKYHE